MMRREEVSVISTRAKYLRQCPVANTRQGLRIFTLTPAGTRLRTSRSRIAGSHLPLEPSIGRRGVIKIIVDSHGAVQERIDIWRQARMASAIGIDQARRHTLGENDYDITLLLGLNDSLERKSTVVDIILLERKLTILDEIDIPIKFRSSGTKLIHATLSQDIGSPQQRQERRLVPLQRNGATLMRGCKEGYEIANQNNGPYSDKQSWCLPHLAIAP